MRHLATNRKKQASLLLVVVSRIPVLAINVALVTAHSELVFRGYLVWKHYAAIIDSAVTTSRNAIFDLQFEISGRTVSPDDKRVALDDGLGSDFADHGAVCHSPISRIALPPGKCLTIENRTKSWFVAREWLRPIALFGDVGLAGLRLRHLLTFQWQTTRAGH